jgi:hypothetical protein
MGNNISNKNKIISIEMTEFSNISSHSTVPIIIPLKISSSSEQDKSMRVDNTKSTSLLRETYAPYEIKSPLLEESYELFEPLLPISQETSLTVSQELVILEEIPPINQEFSVSFTIDAIKLFKRLAGCLEIHYTFRDFVENTPPLLISEFDRIFEQKLAMYISLNIKNRINYEREERWLIDTTYNKQSNQLYIITENDVINEINNIFRIVINGAFYSFPPEHTIQYMLDGYPITLLSTVCNTKRLYSHIMGESIRRFVELRRTHKNWFPQELIGAIDGNLPLTGDTNSPLNVQELNALYRYIGIRKSIYIHILLNCLFEFNRHDIYIQKIILTETELITVLKSSWLYLFLFAYVQNISNTISPTI